MEDDVNRLFTDETTCLFCIYYILFCCDILIPQSA
jgi:hypothetical protein